MKPIFQRRVTFRCSIQSNLTYITKSGLKVLSSIELVNLESDTSNFKTLRAICKALKYSKIASSLIIKKDGSNLQNLRQLKNLLNSSHHHWKKLVLHYTSPGEEQLQEVPEVATRLRRYRGLSTLDVNICCTEDLKNRLLVHFFHQIKGLKTLKTLNLDLSECQNIGELPENYEPNAPVFLCKYPRSLKNLNIFLGKVNLPSQKMIFTFTSNLLRCSSLICFHLDFELKHFQPSETKVLAPLFERVKSLKSFNIHRFFRQHLQFQDGLDFVKDFEYMRNLLEIDLFIFFSLPEEISTVFAKSLFENLALLTNLRALRLALFVRKYPNEQNLFLPLRFLLNLQTFRLGVQCCEDRDLPDLHSLSQALQSLNNLKNFELFFLQNKASRSHLLTISQMFKDLISLQTLNLLFYDADLESDSLELLSNGLSHLKLSSFAFNIRENNSDPHLPFIWKDKKGLISFFSALYDFTSLQTLDLNLSVFDIQTKDLKNFSLALREMKQLCYLSLELPQFAPDWKFQGLRSLMASIKEMSQLSYLELIFKGEKLCDEEVEIIASNLTQCSKSLKILDLDFRKTKELTNKSLFALQNALQTSVSMRNLALAFGPKNTFSGEIVYGLLETLGFLKNLETLTMEFPSEVVPLNFDDILMKFAGHWNLKSFVVNGMSWLISMDQIEQ